MADKREPFPILEIEGTGEGTNLTKAQELDASVGKNAIAGLVGQDPDGNLRYLAVNTLAQVITVPSEDAATNLMDSGLVAGTPASGVNNATKTPVTVASIVLLAGASYTKLTFTVACMRTAEFKIVHVNDVTEVVLAYALVSSGQYTFGQTLEALAFDAGLTGTQELRVIGTLHEQFATDLRGSISIVEEIEV